MTTTEEKNLPTPRLPLWQSAELTRQLVAARPRVAVFDCDGTLWSGDSGFSFMLWSIEQKLLGAERIERLNRRYQGYREGRVSEEAMCGEMVQVYSGIELEAFRAAAARFMSKFVPPRLFSEMAGLLRELAAAGTELWAVSSTCNLVVAEGVRALGIDDAHVLAATAKIVDGRLTEELLDVPTDEGKAASLRRVGLARPDAVFGNSLHDLAMLEIAALPYPVDPTFELATAAGERGWRCFLPVEVMALPSAQSLL